MGFRFYRRVTLFPGVSMNFGKRGTSFSVGPRGLKTTINPTKGLRHSFGIPGTGLSYQTPYKKWGDSSSTAKPPASRKKTSAADQRQSARETDHQKLDLGFWAKLTLSNEEKSLAEGIQAYIDGDINKAKSSLKQASCYPDANFTLGFICLNENRFEDAIKTFEMAEAHADGIGAFYRKYQLEMTLTLCVSPFLTVELPPDLTSTYLGHAEALQHLGRGADACNILLALYKQNSSNLIVIASLSELVLESSPNNIQWMNAIINLTKNLENESYLHAVLLMYKAEAFDNLKMYDAAIMTLTQALRKKADRPQFFINELFYQRGLLYAKSGKKALAIKDFSTVYSKDPNYSDVQQQLSRLL